MFLWSVFKHMRAESCPITLRFRNPYDGVYPRGEIAPFSYSLTHHLSLEHFSLFSRMDRSGMSGFGGSNWYLLLCKRSEVDALALS